MAIADTFILRELVNRLVQLVEENKSSLIEIRDPIYDLVTDLKSLNTTLEQASKNKKSKYVLKEVVDNIRDVICDAEDAICMYTVERKTHTSKPNFIRDSAGVIQCIRNRVKEIQKDHAQVFEALISDHNKGPSIQELINRLVKLVQEKACVIMEIKDQIDDLVAALEVFNAYLKQSGKSKDSLKDVVEMIGNLVTEAEGAIVAAVVVRKKYKAKVGPGSVFRIMEKLSYQAKVYDYAIHIQRIADKVKKIRQENIVPHHPALTQRMAPVVEEDYVVGFDNEVKIIKDRLIGGANDLTFISIHGVAGLGKTTLTKMVFKDHDVQNAFFTRLWVSVSRTFNGRRIFLDILSNLTKMTKEFNDMPEEELAQKVKEFLMDGKYLVVLDDIWMEQDWDYLKMAFPDNMKGSRVLVTTEQDNVALHVDSLDNPHRLKFLTNEESWELLEKKVSHNERCLPLLEALGKQIAITCSGLPLAVLVIAGVLKNSGLKDCGPSYYKQVVETLFPVINQGKQSYNELVKLSYDDLPEYLKDCFLYLAAFPIGHEISAWKIIRLWIAEGFIPLMEGEYISDLECTAEKYLEDLVDRNLLMVLKRKADGRIKTCCVHDALHEFCKTEGANKNLFLEMDGAKHEVDENTRRICVNSSILNLILKSFIKLPYAEQVCSFLLSSGELEIPNENLATIIPKSFPLLRVIDVEYLKFQILPKEFFNLYHLRFLAVSTEQKILSKRFSNLWNMQTLVFNTTQDSLEVKADIWSMPKLRHVLTNTSLQLPSPRKFSKNTSGSTDIRTLFTISPSSCTSEIFNKTPNLQKLGIRGNLVELLESNGFDNLRKLDCLENLKLINDAIDGSMLHSFPRAEKFPRKLRKMTLSNTAFDWNHLSTLGSLDELEVLKLDENAFIGEFCDVSNVVFKKLQYLRIGRTDLVSWTVSKDSFPVLKSLILRYCTCLDAVPAAFGEVESLKLMELYCTSKRATKSAQEIHKLNGDSKNGGFELSIYRPSLNDQDVVSKH